MIIPNGTIEFITKTGSGVDAQGYPVKGVKEYLNPIPCQYIFNGYNQLSSSSGEAFTRQRYTILLEHANVEGFTERIRLKNKAGKEVGEFSIEMVEPLDAVCQTKIIV